MAVAPGDEQMRRHDDGSDDTASVGVVGPTGLLEVGTGQNEVEHRSQLQLQKHAEAVWLRKRGAELEELLVAARSRRTSARERREFMKEEAEEARDYGKRLAQEMARLERVARALSPDDAPSLEKLRRLVATLNEAKLHEQAALEEGQAREAALRAEIEEFTGGNGSQGGAAPPTAPLDAASPPTAAGGLPAVQAEGAVQAAVSGSNGAAEAGVVLGTSADDPLAAMLESKEKREKEDAREEGRVAAVAVAGAAASVSGVVSVPRTTVASGTSDGENGGAAGASGKKPALEGKALLAEGLHRIEAAYQAAAVEREQTASRLSRLRLAVARRQREEDAAPGHAELLQYLLRFEELGRHATERQEQLRRCQAERSTLALTRELLTKQARLLETIAGGVEEASQGGKPAREAYMRQITEIIEGVEDSLQNQKRLLDEARSRRQAAERVQASVKDDRKRFLAGTKELADECYKYEALTAHLALMRR
eukprot:g5546.t1